jgi:3-deoxy-7-phosphoheptulonate synthase
MDNINISSIQKLCSPYELKNKLNLSYENKLFIEQSRKNIINILNNKNQKKLIIVGPCSVHNIEECINYAEELKKHINKYNNLYIILRLYFEKPRTIKGWKGYLYDPYLDGTNKIDIGLYNTRKLLLDITTMKIPIATEFLDTISPQYIDDLISWGCIGARTVESQLHRQLASGLSMPIGFKNRTDGNCEIAINGILSTKESHSFFGIDINGNASIINTLGNINTSIILRGGCKNNNINEETFNNVELLLKQNNLNKTIIIDVSHDNTLKNKTKDYKEQVNNINKIIDYWKNNIEIIKGIMIESFINEGKQSIEDKPLKYGISITDGCINLSNTIILLDKMNNIL